MPDLIAPPQDKIPEEITQRFDAICAAARKQGALVCVKLQADGSTMDQYIVGMVMDGGSSCIPLAIIPTMHVTQFIQYYDGIVKKSGGAEGDPDFKGVRQ